MAATRVAFSDVARAQNPAYRPALPPDKKIAGVHRDAGIFIWYAPSALGAPAQPRNA